MPGYADPPEETRFKEGQSGNPAGRPKGSLNWKTTIWNSLMSDYQTGGKTKLQAGIDKMIERFTEKGDDRAARFLADLTVDRAIEINLNVKLVEALEDKYRDFQP